MILERMRRDETDAREPFRMNGCLEEHLNTYSYFAGDEEAAQFIQLDLLTPIKAK